jgi:hypothetical protein
MKLPFPIDTGKKVCDQQPPEDLACLGQGKNDANEIDVAALRQRHRLSAEGSGGTASGDGLRLRSV